jgi:hypothetical protein
LILKSNTMAIEKRPLRDTRDTKAEREAKNFIEGPGKSPARDKPRKVLITHRVDAELLARIDQLARRRGIGRPGLIFT